MSLVRVSLRVTSARVNFPSATQIARAEGVRRVTDYCRRALSQAIVNCPVDTGNLRAHHRVRMDAGSAAIRGEVYNDAQYAVAVHDGTRAHTIRARRARVLRFRVGGRLVFARWVRHPGTRSRPWLRDAGRAAAVSAGFVWRDR